MQIFILRLKIQKILKIFYVKFQELFDKDVRQQLLKEFEDFVSLFSKVYPIWLIS